MVHRPDVNYPKFKDQFAAMDFEAHILPVLSLYPMPERQALEDWEMKLTDIRGKTVSAAWEDLKKLPRIKEPTPLVCQIFNWSETPLVTGVRLPMLLEAMGMGLSGSRYLSFHSGDGMYFESLPLALARDPRVLVVYGIEGERLPHESGARCGCGCRSFRATRASSGSPTSAASARPPRHQAAAGPEQDLSAGCSRTGKSPHRGGPRQHWIRLRRDLGHCSFSLSLEGEGIISGYQASVFRGQ